MLAHCKHLQDEAALFRSDRRATQPGFDHTFGALLDRYLCDPESSYARLKPGSVVPYTIYAAKLKKHIGNIRIDMTDGRDVQRWFKTWAGVDNLKHPDAKIPRARTTLAVLKAATTFGVVCRLPGCADFCTILSRLEFPTTKPRSYAPVAEQVKAMRHAAHNAGAPSRALAYALQFETTLRQWDVIGVWVPLSDPRPSAVIIGNKKWLGPTWSMVDDHLVLRLTYGKTEDTSALRGVYDLSICPMVMEELQHVALPRSGPLIVYERTGQPYVGRQFETGWRADFKAAGLPPGMWNRDLRAGADTEASMAGARLDDRAKLHGHTSTKMLEQVYDRDRLGAQARVMELRVAKRRPEE